MHLARPRVRVSLSLTRGQVDRATINSPQARCGHDRAEASALVHMSVGLVEKKKCMWEREFWLGMGIGDWVLGPP